MSLEAEWAEATQEVLAAVESVVQHFEQLPQPLSVEYLDRLWTCMVVFEHAQDELKRCSKATGKDG